MANGTAGYSRSHRRMYRRKVSNYMNDNIQSLKHKKNITDNMINFN